MLEAIGLSFFFLFIVKGGDIFSIDLWLLSSGIKLAVFVFLPFLYLFSVLSYASARVSKTGAPLKGFIASDVYGLHPSGSVQ